MHCEQKGAKKLLVGEGKGEGQNVHPSGHGLVAGFEGVNSTSIFARKSASMAPCLSGYYVKSELLRHTVKVGKPHFRFVFPEEGQFVAFPALLFACFGAKSASFFGVLRVSPEGSFGSEMEPGEGWGEPGGRARIAPKSGMRNARGAFSGAFGRRSDCAVFPPRAGNDLRRECGSERRGHMPAPAMTFRVSTRSRGG